MGLVIIYLDLFKDIDLLSRSLIAILGFKKTIYKLVHLNNNLD